MNPKLKNLHFIAIEELIMNSSLDFLTSYFADIISQEDMDSFQKKMLKYRLLCNSILCNYSHKNTAMLPLVIIISGVTSFFTSNSEIDEGKTIFSFATPFIMLLLSYRVFYLFVLYIFLHYK